MKIGRTGQIEFSDLIGRIAEGQRPKRIAGDLGLTVNCVHKRIHHHLRMAGYQTLEQAVAYYVVRKVQAGLPLALRGQLDMLMGLFKPKPEKRRPYPIRPSRRSPSNLEK